MEHYDRSITEAQKRAMGMMALNLINSGLFLSKMFQCLCLKYQSIHYRWPINIYRIGNNFNADIRVLVTILKENGTGAKQIAKKLQCTCNIFILKNGK